MTTTDHSRPHAPVGNSGAQDPYEAVASQTAEDALIYESRSMSTGLNVLVRQYRRNVRDHSPGGAEYAKRGPHAPCPVCGERSAVISNDDPGYGPSVTIRCENDYCGADQIIVLVRTGDDWNHAGQWPAETPLTAPRKRRETTERANQSTWRKMWRVRHGGTLLCNFCGASENDTEIQLDHIVELRDGGEDADWNVQPLCHSCHLTKTTSPINRDRRRRAAA